MLRSISAISLLVLFSSFFNSGCSLEQKSLKPEDDFARAIAIDGSHKVIVSDGQTAAATTSPLSNVVTIMPVDKHCDYKEGVPNHECRVFHNGCCDYEADLVAINWQSSGKLMAERNKNCRALRRKPLSEEQSAQTNPPPNPPPKPPLCVSSSERRVHHYAVCGEDNTCHLKP
jgi:hypothetical protein